MHTRFAASALVQRFSTGDERTLRARKNVLISGGCKVLRIVVGMMLVPMAIGYLDTTRYGIWLMVTALFEWIRLFDMGLGNGLRNCFTQAMAANDPRQAKAYVSTAYAGVGAIMLGAFLLFALVQPFLPWDRAFNVGPGLRREIGLLAVCACGFFCLRFVLELVVKVCQGNQWPAVQDIVELASGLLMLGALWVLIRTNSTGSLIRLGLAMSITPNVVLIVLSVGFFTSIYRAYVPSPRYVALRYMRRLMGLGIRFFVIQFGFVILFVMDGFVVAHLFGPAEVTTLQVAKRYMAVPLMFFGVLVSPLWSAAADAFCREDKPWITRTVSRLHAFWLLAVCCVGLMVAASSRFYALWLKEMAVIPLPVTIAVGGLVAVQMLGSIYTTIINGSNRLAIQMWSSVVAVVLNVPLAVFLSRMCRLGLSGVVLATTLLLAASLFLQVIQYRKIMEGSAHGIWNT